MACGLGRLVLQIAGDGDTVFRHSEGHEAATVVVGLDGEAIYPTESGSEKPPEPSHSAEAAVADPAVEDHRRQSVPLDLAKNQRPEVSLAQDQRPRIEAIQEPPDRESEVER